MNIDEIRASVTRGEAALARAQALEAATAAAAPTAQAERDLAHARDELAKAERAADEKALRKLEAEAAALESELADVAANVVRIDAGLRHAVQQLGDLEERSRGIAIRSEAITRRLGVPPLQARTDFSRHVRLHLGAALTAQGVRSCETHLLDPHWPVRDYTHTVEARVHAEMVEAGREALEEVTEQIAADVAAGNTDTPHTRQLRERRLAILRGLGRSDDGDHAA